jgi:hypothetical protein
MAPCRRAMAMAPKRKKAPAREASGLMHVDKGGGVYSHFAGLALQAIDGHQDRRLGQGARNFVADQDDFDPRAIGMFERCDVYSDCSRPGVVVVEII